MTQNGREDRAERPESTEHVARSDQAADGAGRDCGRQPLRTPHAAYIDPASGGHYPLDVPRWRADPGSDGRPGGPLLITPGCGITAGDIELNVRGLWRYRAALPLEIRDPISLGEGGTPLVPLAYGSGRPLAKLEWFSPTGSFKDRGASVMLSVLRQQGVTRVIEDSSGNGGAAIAAYAAAGGLNATVFAPASTSPAKLVQARAYGARVELVDGPREASQEAAIAAAERGAGFYASHNWQAFFLEGTKTLAYEMWEGLSFRAPDSVVVPVGAGSSLLGCAFGFRELLRAGAIDRMPRLYAAQPLACSPVDAAFHVEHGGPAVRLTHERANSPVRTMDIGVEVRDGPRAGSAASSELFGRPASRPVLATIAEGAAIARPLRLAQILSAITESRGGTVAVSEAQISEAHALLARAGLFAEPTSAVAAAGYEALVRRGEICPDEVSIVLLTGSGLKAPAP